jgi:hypothetical protein
LRRYTEAAVLEAADPGLAVAAHLKISADW